MEDKQSGIYKITSPSGRVYIGQAYDIKLRFSYYKAARCKGQKLLHSSLVKYGFDAHKSDVIEYCPKEELDSKEMFWIRSHMSNVNRYPEHKGLNLSDGGGGNRGYKTIVSESIKEKRRERALSPSGIVAWAKENKLMGDKNPFFGKKHTDETRAKMRGKHNRPFYAVSPEGERLLFNTCQEFKDKVGCDYSTPNKCLSEKSKLKFVFGWKDFEYADKIVIKNNVA